MSVKDAWVDPDFDPEIPDLVVELPREIAFQLSPGDMVYQIAGNTVTFKAVSGIPHTHIRSPRHILHKLVSPEAT